MLDILGKLASIVVPFATLAASAVGIYTGIAGASQQRRLVEAQQRQYEAEAAAAKAAAVQEEAQRRDELRRVLATQAAIRAGRGLDIADATGRAFAAESEEEAELDISNIRSNASRTLTSLTAQSRGAAARGRAAVFDAWGNVGRGVLSGLAAMEKVPAAAGDARSLFG